MTGTYRFGRRVVLGLAAGVAALLGGFALLADEVLEGDTLGFDTAVLAATRTPGNPADPLGPVWLEEAARDLTALGSFTVLGFIIIIVTCDLLLRRKLRIAAFLVTAVISGTILSTGLKSVFDRARPDLPAVARVFTASFPSGHAALSAVVYLTLGVLLAEAASRWRFRLLYIGVAIGLTLAVGISRVYLGVHYPTDVLAGWLLGTSWALLCWVVAELLDARRDRNGEEASAS